MWIDGHRESRAQSHGTYALALAAISAGADALFMEVHDDPDNAKSDPATVYPLEKLAELLDGLRKFAALTRQKLSL